MNQYLLCDRDKILRKILKKNKNKNIIKDLIEAFLHIKIKSIKINKVDSDEEYYMGEKEEFGVVDVRVVKEDNEELNVGIFFINRNACRNTNNFILFRCTFKSNII